MTLGEVVEQAVSEGSQKAIADHALKPAIQPRVEPVGDINDVVDGKADLSFTVTVDPGYHVASLLVDGNAATLTAGKYVFTNVTADHTIAVTFAIDAFTLTSSAGANGSITPSVGVRGANVVRYQSLSPLASP